MAELISEINYIEEITKTCNAKMQELNFNLNENYLKVLKKELKDLEDWMPYGNINMAKRIYELKSNTKEPINSNKSGSLILFLTGISAIDPIANELAPEIVALTTGDCPDIDTDFDPRYRGWVKQLIVKLFGEEKTCSIGSYQTYKTRACIVDVSRALGLDVQLATDITKKMSPLSKHENDEGEDEKIDDMDWDEICKIYPELLEYFNQNPEVLVHCKVLRNQVKNMSKHAGGMIISNHNLQDKIPVVRGKEGLIISSWSEGQATHELSEVGLVKFDILGLCLEKDTEVKTNKGNVKIQDLDGLQIQILDSLGNPKLTDEFLLINTGQKDILEIELEDGSQVRCSPDHKFFIKV